MALTTQQQQIVEQRLADEAKSPLVAYLLWFFLGVFGAHRLYFGKYISGVGMFALFWVGFWTVFIIIGLVFLAAFLVWWIVDAFLIRRMVDADLRAKRTAIAIETKALE